MKITCKICNTTCHVKEGVEICYDCEGMMEAWEEISKQVDFKELGPIKIFALGYNVGYAQGSDEGGN